MGHPMRSPQGGPAVTFSYPGRTQAEFDQRVEADLELIARTLEGEFPGQFEALVLVGAFGRGEGTMLKKDGEVYPVHDYDIVAVTRTELPHDKVAWVAGDLASKLGLPHVDLFAYRKTQLAAFGPSRFAVDLKGSGYVFHGDPAVLDLIHLQDPAKLPVDEARRLLFHRLPSLLECVQEADFHRDVEGEDAFRIAYMASKVILSAVEALAIESGDYHPSYREREQRFQELHKRHAHLCGLVAAATAIKLRGRIPAGFDAVRYWLWARRFYLATLFRIVCRSYETPLADWWDLASFYDRWLFFFMRKAWNRVFNRAKYHEWVSIQQRVKLELALVFLQLARESRTQVRPHYLTAARDFLTAVTGKKAPLDWEEARRVAVEWDYRILHPHG